MPVWTAGPAALRTHRAGPVNCYKSRGAHSARTITAFTVRQTVPHALPCLQQIPVQTAITMPIRPAARLAKNWALAAHPRCRHIPRRTLSARRIAAHAVIRTALSAVVSNQPVPSLAGGAVVRATPRTSLAPAITKLADTSNRRMPLPTHRARIVTAGAMVYAAFLALSLHFHVPRCTFHALVLGSLTACTGGIAFHALAIFSDISILALCAGIIAGKAVFEAVLNAGVVHKGESGLAGGALV